MKLDKDPGAYNYSLLEKGNLLRKELCWGKLGKGDYHEHIILQDLL